MLLIIKHSFSSFVDSRFGLCRQVQEEEQIECGPKIGVNDGLFADRDVRDVMLGV